MSRETDYLAARIARLERERVQDRQEKEFWRSEAQRRMTSAERAESEEWIKGWMAREMTA